MDSLCCGLSITEGDYGGFQQGKLKKRKKKDGDLRSSQNNIAFKRPKATERFREEIIDSIQHKDRNKALVEFLRIRKDKFVELTL